MSLLPSVKYFQVKFSVTKAMLKHKHVNYWNAQVFCVFIMITVHVPWFITGAELELHFTKEDTILISEDDYVNVTFWLSPAKSERCHDDFYIIEVKTRCSDGRVEYEGRVLRWNETCKVSFQQSVRCISETGPAELYRKVKCSKMDIEWVWTWKDCESGKLKSKGKNVKLFKESCKYALSEWFFLLYKSLSLCFYPTSV